MWWLSSFKVHNFSKQLNYRSGGSCCCCVCLTTLLRCEHDLYMDTKHSTSLQSLPASSHPFLSKSSGPVCMTLVLPKAKQEIIMEWHLTVYCTSNLINTPKTHFSKLIQKALGYFKIHNWKFFLWSLVFHSWTKKSVEKASSLWFKTGAEGILVLSGCT